jgi:tetratricopeptide (TPR) repeat protein
MKNLAKAWKILKIRPDSMAAEIQMQFCYLTEQMTTEYAILENPAKKKEFLSLYHACQSLIKNCSDAEIQANIELFPLTSQSQWYLNLGIAALLKNEWPQAQTFFSKVCSLNDFSAVAIMYQGVHFLKINQFPQAEALMTQAVKMDHNFSLGWFYLGELYRQTDQFRKALTMFETAWQLNTHEKSIKAKINNLRKSLNLPSPLIEIVRQCFKK